MRHQPIFYLTSSLIIAITLFMGSIILGHVEKIGSIFNQPSILAAPPLSPETSTHHQTTQQLGQGAQAAPTIWLNTDTRRPGISFEAASIDVPPYYQLFEADPALSDQTCSTDDLFPALPRTETLSSVNPTRSWQYVIDLLTSRKDQKYYVPIISPLKNVEEYTLVDGATTNEDSTTRSVVGCNEQAMFMPASIMTVLSMLSTSLDRRYVQ